MVSDLPGLLVCPGRSSPTTDHRPLTSAHRPTRPSAPRRLLRLIRVRAGSSAATSPAAPGAAGATGSASLAGHDNAIARTQRGGTGRDDALAFFHAADDFCKFLLFDTKGDRANTGLSPSSAGNHRPSFP